MSSTLLKELTTGKLVLEQNSRARGAGRAAGCPHLTPDCFTEDGMCQDANTGVGVSVPPNKSNKAALHTDTTRVVSGSTKG